MKTEADPAAKRPKIMVHLSRPGYPLGLLVMVVLLWIGVGTADVWGASQDPVALVTGGWPPYTGESLQGRGLAVERVKAVFRETMKMR